MPDRFRRNLTPLAQREERVCALSRLQAFAVVRGGVVDGRAFRHDAARVHRGMAAVVVVLDVVQVDGLGDARHLVESARVVSQVGIVAESTPVALEAIGMASWRESGWRYGLVSVV